MSNKASHQANVVQIKEILPHSDADNIELIKINDYQVVVRKGEFKPGDFGVYIHPDSVVPQTEPFKFIWGPYAEILRDEAFFPYSKVPEKKRRITVRRFRGEWSEGLLLPLSDFNLQIGQALVPYPDSGGDLLREGDDISELLGITHYVPEGEDTKGNNMHAPRKKSRYPKTFRGWFFFILHKLGIRTKHRSFNDEHGESLGIPSYDVDALKNYKNVFVPGEEVIVTEKIHGSNARYVYLDGVMYAGSRNFWKAPDSNDIWRKVLKTNPHIEAFCKSHPGYVLYGEVTPTQSSGKHKYTYGSNEPQFWLFDIRTPEGKWLDYDESLSLLTSDNDGFFIQIVPLLYRGKFDSEKVKELAEGKSELYDYIREGVVVKAVKERKHYGPSLHRAQLKVVSNKFLEKDK